jgi:hypothetical protein
VKFLAEQLMKNAIVPPGFREDGAKPCCFAGCKRPDISCELQRPEAGASPESRR